MNKIEIGQKYEKIGEGILEKMGYSIIEHASKTNWKSHYDFEVKKEGKEYYIEVRGREEGKCTNYFTFSKKKITFLRELNKKVFLLCINQQGHIFFPLKDISNYTKPIRIDKNIIYIVDIKKFKKELNEFEKKVIETIRQKYKIDSYLKVVEHIIRVTVDEFEKKK